MTDKIRAAAIEAAYKAYADLAMQVIGKEERLDVKILIDAAISAFEAAAWRPIEEAPRNTKVLVKYLNIMKNKRLVLATYYTKGALEADESCEYPDEDGCAPEGWYEESETRETLLPLEYEPTMFRLLPTPPQEPSDAK
jgi:hypothetical protein